MFNKIVTLIHVIASSLWPIPQVLAFTVFGNVVNIIFNVFSPSHIHISGVLSEGVGFGLTAFVLTYPQAMMIGLGALATVTSAIEILKNHWYTLNYK